jgi:hypothetical protein
MSYFAQPVLGRSQFVLIPTTLDDAVPDGHDVHDGAQRGFHVADGRANDRPHHDLQIPEWLWACTGYNLRKLILAVGRLRAEFAALAAEERN